MDSGPLVSIAQPNKSQQTCGKVDSCPTHVGKAPECKAILETPQDPHSESLMRDLLCLASNGAISVNIMPGNAVTSRCQDSRELAQTP